MWRSDFRVRLGDLDGLGHLTATAYLELLEETRSQWMMEALGMAYPTYVLATQTIDYLHEVRLDDGPVTVVLGVTELRNSSLDLLEQLTTASAVCARSTATIVMWDIETRRPRPILPAERKIFTETVVRPDQFDGKS